MIKTTDIFLTKNDLEKISNRGCKICGNNNFSWYNLKEMAICKKCGTSYHPVGEGALDCLAKTQGEIKIYRSSSIDNPREDYSVQTKKYGYSLKKTYSSQK